MANARHLKTVLPSSWLDNIGLKYGMPRFKNETYSLYRRRLLDHIRHLPEPTQESYLRTINRTVGHESMQLVKLTPKAEWNETLEEYVLVAEDPYIEIDSCFLRIWKNHKLEDPVVELNIMDRNEAYFLGDVFDAIDSVDFLEVQYLQDPERWKWKKSSHLAYGNTLGNGEEALVGSKLNVLNKKYIIDARFDNEFAFEREVTETDSKGVNENGQYHIDYVSGMIFTNVPAAGRCSYTYRKFPYILKWEPVKAFPFNDKSIDHLIKDKLINENGNQERLLLNSYGADIINRILSLHPLQWGK